MFLSVSSNPTTKISLTSLVNSIDFPKLSIHNSMIIFQSPNKERRKSLLITWMSLLPNHDLNRGSNTWMFLLPNHDSNLILNPYTNGIVHSFVNNKIRIPHGLTNHTLAQILPDPCFLTIGVTSRLPCIKI